MGFVGRSNGEWERPAATSNLDITYSVTGCMLGLIMILQAKRFGAVASPRRFWSALFTVGPGSFVFCMLGAGRGVGSNVDNSGVSKVCQRTPLVLPSELLKRIEDIVERELLRRTALGQPSSLSWVAEHQKLYATMRIQWGGPSPHSATSSSRWPKTLPALHKSKLVYRQHTCLASCRAGESMAEAQCREFAFWLGPECRPQCAERTVGRWGDDHRAVPAAGPSVFGCTFLARRGGSCGVGERL